jgi:glutathione synthase/RimK-type ligase-like ATP-grasp enzyme
MAAATHDGPLITLATCAAWPGLSVSDQCLAEALRARQQHVTVAPWNGPFEPFADAAAVVIRSTWDYHQTPDAYLAWLDRLDPRRTFNEPPLIRWNVSKSHILDLARRGAHVPRSLETAAEPDAIARALDALGLHEGVIKPLIGASGFGVERVTRGNEAVALERARARKAQDRVLVQEFMAEIRDGELAGVFFEGAFSHGLWRRPAAGEFRINSQYGGTLEPAALPAAVIEAMSAVLSLLPQPAVYARVDGVVRDGHFIMMELEVNEPGLGLDLAPGSADRFTEALLRRL